MKINKLILLGLITILSSCSTGGSSITFKSGTTVEGQPITDTFDLQQKDEVLETLEECYNLAEAATDYAAFDAKYQKINEYYDQIDKAHNASSLRYYMYGKEEDSNNETALYDLLLSIYNKADKIHHLIFNNAFKDQFYEGMSDEEILKEIGEEYPDAYYEKLNRKNEIEADYNNLDSSAFNYNSQVKKLFVEFVKNNNELAQIAGYDSYIEYAYKEVYGRDYDYTLTDNFYQYVKDYVAETARANYGDFIYKISWNEALRNLFYDYAGYADDSGFVSGNAFTKYFDWIQNYANYFGGDYKQFFDDAWYVSNRYYISYEEDAMAAAYTNNSEKYMFFGKRYEMNTVVHEFGHYYTAMVNPDDNDLCFDLAETQSQANEFLFCTFILNNNYYTGDGAKLIAQYNCLDKYMSILNATCINEFEKWAYKEEDLTTSKLDSYCTHLIEDLGLKGTTLADAMDLATYWKLVCINNPLYYISYATSAIGALEIYATSQKNLNDGIEQYKKIVHYNKQDAGDFIKVYQSAGLASPFDEQSFINIFGEK